MKAAKVIAMTLVMMMMAGAAMAADNATVDVQATVLGVCTFSVDNTLLDFGNLDPTAPAAASVNNSNLEFACSTGVGYAITDDDGLNELGFGQPQLADGAGEFIPYTLTYVGAGVGTGVATNLNVAADIAAGVYATNSPGVYSDTVTLTINP